MQYKHNVRHVQKINDQTKDRRINIPEDMNVTVGELYLFERIDDKTIKLTKVA